MTFFFPFSKKGGYRRVTNVYTRLMKKWIKAFSCFVGLVSRTPFYFVHFTRRIWNLPVWGASRYILWCMWTTKKLFLWTFIYIITLKANAYLLALGQTSWLQWPLLTSLMSASKLGYRSKTMLLWAHGWTIHGIQNCLTCPTPLVGL